MRTIAKPGGRRARRLVINGALAMALIGATYVATSPAEAAPGFPEPTKHSQTRLQSVADFTVEVDPGRRPPDRGTVGPERCRRARTRCPRPLTMPTVSGDFPDTNPEVWVWDTWTLTDGNADQLSFKGWEVIFALTADRSRRLHVRRPAHPREARVLLPQGRHPASRAAQERRLDLRRATSSRTAPRRHSSRARPTRTRPSGRVRPGSSGATSCALFYTDAGVQPRQRRQRTSTRRTRASRRASGKIHANKKKRLADRLQRSSTSS